MSSDAERIVRLEVQMQIALADNVAMKADLHSIKTSQDTMLMELQRYRGLFGGVVLTVSAMWAFLQFIGPMMVDFFKNLKS